MAVALPVNLSVLAQKIRGCWNCWSSVFPADLFYTKAVKILMAAHIISCLKPGTSTDKAWIYRKKAVLGWWSVSWWNYNKIHKSIKSMLDWWVFGPRRRTQTVVIKLNRAYYHRQIKRRNQGWWVRAERHNERYSVRVKKQINFRLTEWYWNKHFKQVEAEEPKADEMKLINTPRDTQLISDTRDTNTGTWSFGQDHDGAEYSC